MRRFFFMLCVGMLVPMLCCRAAVRITEVAWMGIAGANGQFGEWIELYNDGTAAVDLAGWKLLDGGGGTLVFTLSKSIDAGGYLLIERTTASMSDPVPGVDDEHGAFGGGGLSNDGEDLVLKDGSGASVQSLSYASGWPAGDAASKDTMQWNGSGWSTAPATPKVAYAGGGGNEEGDGEDPPDNEEDGEAQEGDGGGSEPVPKKHTPKLTLDVPNELYQYVEYTLTADMVLEDGLHHTSGPFKWNLGDGTAFVQQRLEPVVHRYRYPGVYTIRITYYKGPFDTKPHLELTKAVRVGTPPIEASVVNGEAVEIANHSSASVDLSRWQVLSGGQYAILPEGTLIAPESSVVMSADTLGFLSLPDVRLARPTGEPLGVPAAPKVRGASAAAVLEARAVTDAPQESESIFADQEAASSTDQRTPPTRNRTKTMVFGAAALVVMVLSILLERVMAKRE